MLLWRKSSHSGIMNSRRTNRSAPRHSQGAGRRGADNETTVVEVQKKGSRHDNRLTHSESNVVSSDHWMLQ